MPFQTTAQPNEIFTLSMDFSLRMQPGEAVSLANSDCLVFQVDTDGNDTDVSATFNVGALALTAKTLSQKVTWAASLKGEKYKVSFRAKVGADPADSLYEDDIEILVTD